MRHLTKIVLLAYTAVLGVSCEGPQASRPRADSPEVVARVRARVLDQLPALDSVSREMIRTNSPKFGYSGVPFGGAHIFQWAVSSNRVVELDTFNFDHIESEPVKVWQRVPNSRY